MKSLMNIDFYEILLVTDFHKQSREFEFFSFYSKFVERADLLALLWVMFPCVLSLSHMAPRVRCGT